MKAIRCNGMPRFAAVGFGEILKRDRHHWSSWNPHLFVFYAVTDGRWRARASMSDRHDDCLPFAFISALSFGSSSAKPPAFSRYSVCTLGMFFWNQSPPAPKMIRSGKSIGDEINGLAVE